MHDGNHFNSGSMAWDEGRLADAFQEFQLGARQGDPNCQMSLGYFFDCGIHVEQNTRQALSWYFRAFRQGDAAAANNIATVYRDQGEYGKSLRWYLRSAQLGDGDAFVEIGKIYEAGIGIPVSSCLADRYYRKALEHPNITIAGKQAAMAAIRRIRGDETT